MAAQPQGVAGKGPVSCGGPMSSAEPSRLFGAGAEHTLCQAGLSSSSPLGYHLYLHKLVDFPPQLNRLTASEIGFEFLVWTNQWATRKTTKTTTKEMVSECYLKNHRVSKEKSLVKKIPGARQGKKFHLQYIDQCKTIKHYLLHTILDIKTDLMRFTFRLFQSINRTAK